ncbi:MAG: sigma-70 family RNA polymerase sigma factor, partial [Clostridia bacterium]
MNRQVDEEFIDMLYQAYYNKLRSYCFAFVSGKTQYAEDIDECIQDVFLLAYRKRTEVENCGYLEAWLKDACMRRMKKTISKACGKRKQATLCSIETLSPDSIYLSSNPTERWEDQDEAQVQLAVVFDALSEEEKKIGIMYWENGVSLKELAGYLHMSVGT